MLKIDIMNLKVLLSQICPPHQIVAIKIWEFNLLNRQSKPIALLEEQRHKWWWHDLVHWHGWVC